MYVCVCHPNVYTYTYMYIIVYALLILFMWNNYLYSMYMYVCYLDINGNYKCLYVAPQSLQAYHTRSIHSVPIPRLIPVTVPYSYTACPVSHSLAAFQHSVIRPVGTMSVCRGVTCKSSAIPGCRHVHVQGLVIVHSMSLGKLTSAYVNKL